MSDNNYLVLPFGFRGEKGDDAYTVWLSEGNVGAVADFLADVKGEKGDQGGQGIQGVIGLTGLKGYW